MPSETTTSSDALEHDVVAPLVDPDVAASDSEPAGAEPAETSESTSRRVRRRLARLGTVRAPSGPAELAPLFRTLRATHPKADLRVVQRAYEVAEVCHRGQARRPRSTAKASQALATQGLPAGIHELFVAEQTRRHAQQNSRADQ